MVYITHLPTFLSLVALVTIFLNSSVESTNTEECGKYINSSTEKEKYIVLLKSEKENEHKKWLDSMGIKKQSIHDDSFSYNSKRKEDVVYTFSVKGVINGYTTEISKEFMENCVSKRSEVKLIEADKKVKINYAIPSSIELFKRTVDNDPTPNIDRVDQAKFPLNGKYNFPDSAGEGVNIFVVDTGVRITHSEFEDRAKFGGSFCDGCNDDDENGHGTHVSSIAAGKTLGVARKANIIGVRVLDADGSGSNAGVIEGLSFVGDQHKKSKNKNSVVNMSLGGGFSQAVNDAVNDLTTAGIHVAVAAGNDGEDACKSSPASELSAITVGATEDTSDDVTDFSNIGKCLDIFAPGRNIEGAGIANDNDRAVFSGTSQATPHVAGTIALIISKDGKNQSPASMAKALNKLSTKGVVKGLSNGSPDSFIRIPAP